MSMVVNGVISKLWFNELKQPDNYGNTVRVVAQFDGEVKGMDMDKMEAVSFDGIKVNIGGRKDKRFAIKLGAGFHDLKEGDEITFTLTTNTGANGVTYYNGKSIKLKQAAAKSKQPSGGQQKQSFKKDMTGVSVGHALNGAFRFLKGGKVADDSVVIKTACFIHDLTTKLKAAYAKKHPDMSDYDVGAAVGHAILNACDIAKKEDEIQEKAIWVLQLVKPVTEYVKEGKIPVAEEKTKEPETPVLPDEPPFEPDEYVNDDNVGGSEEDFEMDDIPF